jgi:Tetratricopeptide repeat.
MALLNSQQYQEALTCLNQALQINPDLAAIWISRAQTLLELKQYQAAIASFDKSYSIKTSNFPEAWLGRGKNLYVN